MSILHVFFRRFFSLRFSSGHRAPVAHTLRVPFYCTSRFPVKGRNVLRPVQYNSEDIATGTSSHPGLHNSTLQSSDPHPVIRRISQRHRESRFSGGQFFFRLSIVQEENSTNFIETLFKIFFRIFWGKWICFSNTVLRLLFTCFLCYSSIFILYFLVFINCWFCTSCGFSFTTGFSGMTRTRRFWPQSRVFFYCILASIIAVILTNYTISAVNILKIRWKRGVSVQNTPL